MSSASLSSGQYVLRPAALSDAQMLWQLRNDPAVRQSAFNTDPIEWKAHCRWLKRKLNSPDCRIWILGDATHSIGQIRYDRVDDYAEIDFAVAASFRGQGWGTRLLQLSAPRACHKLGVQRLVGIVKIDNRPSTRAFERAGFRHTETLIYENQTCLKFERFCGEDL